MDLHDAILEQLKRAQTAGLETVTNRLDFVVESLDELVQEMRSAVLKAAPREGEELFPVADVESLVAQLRDRAVEAEGRVEHLAVQATELQQRLDEALQRAEDAARAATEATQRVPATGEAAAGISLELFRRLDRARGQSELLKELLPVLADFAGRSVILVMRGTGLSAWSGVGLEDPERLRGWQGEVQESEAFATLNREAAPVRCAPATDPLLARWLAGESPAVEGLLVPVCLRGKLMGAVYLDRVEGRPWRPDEAQALVALTCWLIDTLGHRQTVPSPMVAEPVDLRGEVTEAEALPAEEPEAALAVEGVAPADDFDARSTVRVELPAEPVVTPAVVAEPEPEPEPEPEAVAVEAPPEPRPLTPEEQAKHEEARRFARLLVSEIKLYNEEEVERGRVNRDLYHRLKDDVDRSREMYDKRISPEVRTARDYFYEELVRILADGDPDALGM